MRSFRGSRLRIEVHNPQHVSRGVVRMEVDGVTQVGNVVKVEGLPVGEHRVEVWLGR